jgi:hypothetical protein
MSKEGCTKGCKAIEPTEKTESARGRERDCQPKTGKRERKEESERASERGRKRRERAGQRETPGQNK